MSAQHILRHQDFWFAIGMTTLCVEIGSFPSITGMLTRFIQCPYSVAMRPRGPCGYRTSESPLLYRSNRPSKRHDYSRRLRLRLSGSNVECNKDSSDVLAVRQSWSTMPLESFREELLLLLESYSHTSKFFSEGTHAKYHYMICGVQGKIPISRLVIAFLTVGLAGDFTRSLVNDPPRTLWTRELKVSPDHPLPSHMGGP